MDQLNETRFLTDVAKHEMTILRDDGLHRHVRFRMPDTTAMLFDLITWPGFLCYSGDMGCYVFTRLEDMFEFFRSSGHNWKDDRKLHINRPYWAEKCVAADREGVMEYNADRFRELIVSRLNEAEASTQVRAAVETEVLAHAHDGEHAAMRAAVDFEHVEFRFQDFWEANARIYTYRYTWCCYALAWGIRQYDAAKVRR